MKLKKIVHTSLKVLFALFIAVFAYFVYLAIWTYRFNADQREIVKNIDADFCQTSQIIRDPNGLFWNSRYNKRSTYRHALVRHASVHFSCQARNP